MTLSLFDFKMHTNELISQQIESDWDRLYRNDPMRNTMYGDVTVDSRKTISVPEAGRRYFELSRGACYAAAARGDIPTIKIGRKLRVPIVAIERMLENVGTRDANAVGWGCR
jgi:hypothetical protein